MKLAWIIFAIAACVARAQTEPPDEPPPPPAPEVRWAPELAALSPDSPRGYFELAERVLDEVKTPADHRMGIALLALAFDLDRARVAPQGVAAPSCLLLADVPELRTHRQWLLSIAASVDRRFAGIDRQERRSIPKETGYLAATALGLIRSGDGAAARKILQTPEVRSLIQAYGRLLSPIGAVSGIADVDTAAASAACPECRSERMIKVPRTNPPQYRVCPVCKGNPGPVLPPEKLAAELRFESRLLSGVHRSWAAQASADGSAPLRDPDPAELAPTLNVDTSRPLFRNGKWVAPPKPPPPAQPEGPTAKPAG